MPDGNTYFRCFTKSLFNLAHECPTKLYYYNKAEYPSDKEGDEFLRTLAEGGFQVGALAKCYFPEGVEVVSLEHLEALRQTETLLKEDEITIFEAAVRFEDFFARVDILRKTGNHLDLIEVKSKSYYSDADVFVNQKGDIEPKWQPYLYDVAFQTCILEQAFPQFTVSPYLMLVDKSKMVSVNGLNQKFRLIKKDGHAKVLTNGDISVEALGTKILTLVSVKEYIDVILAEEPEDEPNIESVNFLDKIREYASYYMRDERYPVSIAKKCKSCEFYVDPNVLGPGQKSGFRECWQTQLGWQDDDFAKPLIFDIWNFRQVQDCMNQGIYYMKDVPLKELFMKRNKRKELTFKNSTAERQHLQVVKTCHETQVKENVKPGLFDEMEKWTFPLHFIDFETSMVAIPFSKGRRPYELIAFQFSSHTIHEDGRFEHHEWISREPGVFPNFDFLVALKDVLDKDNGTVFRYAAHENTVLQKVLAQLQNEMQSGDKSIPENSEELIRWIKSITEWNETVQVGGKVKTRRVAGKRNMVDMCDLVKKFYYHPRMRGSNSIKAVLPAILSAGDFLKERYAKRYTSNNFESFVWWQADASAELPIDPYSMLPPLFENVDLSKDVLLLESDHIDEGGAAMLAYAKMQFSEMTAEERHAIIKGLLKYCELDTLAMVMIFEHWNYLKNNNRND